MASPNDPRGAASLPSVFPPWIDRLQMRYMNPVMRRLARYLPGASVIKHRGRTSGRPYETVITPYRKGGVLAIALGHGRTDWVKNVLAAGGAEVQLFQHDVRITNPQILPAGSGGHGLPWLVRLQLRRVAVLVAEIA
jgi:deazaflavin-dependent oxidoreductase (nitroreductase family)